MSPNRKSKFAEWAPPLGYPEEAAYWVRNILKDPKRDVLILLPGGDPEMLKKLLYGPAVILKCDVSLEPAIRSSCADLSYGKDGFRDLFKALRARGVSKDEFWKMLGLARFWYCWALFFLINGEVQKHVRRSRYRFYLSMTRPGKNLRRIDEQDKSIFDDWIKQIEVIRLNLAGSAEDLPSTLTGLNRWQKIPTQGQEILGKMLGKETVKGMLRHSAQKAPLLHVLPFWNHAIALMTKELRAKGFKGDEVFALIGWSFHLFFPSFWPVSVLTWKSEMTLEDLKTSDSIRTALTTHIKRRYYDHA